MADDLNHDGELKRAKLRADALIRDLDDSLKEANKLRKQAEESIKRMKLISVIAKSSNEAITISDALQSTLDEICNYTGWAMGHFYVQLTTNQELAGTQLWRGDQNYKPGALDGRNELISAQIWHVDDSAAFAPLKERIESIALMPGFGFVGQVLQTGEPNWTLDTGNEDIILPQELAKEIGIAARYAFPIVNGGKVQGVMEFFARQAVEPDAELLETMYDIGIQLGHVIQRKGHEEKLNLLEEVIMNSNDGIVITKADTLDGKGPEILFVNDAFAAISGYAREEVIGKSPRFLHGPKTNRETLNQIRRCLEDNQPFKGELLNYGKNGHEYWLDISIVPLRNDKGRVTHFAAIERDITAQKKNQERLENEIRRAEAASRAKSDFLANMSHELRTPMNGVLGMAGLLKDTRLDGEQRNLVETICNSGESLLLLLNDILDFSKIEAGELSLEVIPFNLNQLVHGTTRLLEPIAKKKGLILTTHADASIPDFVVSDPTRIRQVITNLIGNAIKFTEKGFIKVGLQAQGLPDGRTELKVTVEDTGIGIKAQNLDKIFQKFTQADESTTRRFGGTGLGLTICKLLIEKMGGEIGVTSIEGKGSCFYFTLPVSHVTGDQAEQLREENRTVLVVPHDRDIDYSRSRVLVIDDHPVNLVFARKLLSKIGIGTVDAVDNGAEALQMMAQGRYDMIITDCQMPEMDGYEVCREIRAREEGSGKRIPVIAMTANAMVGDREKCLAAGMDDYVSKPISENRMIDALMKWLKPREVELGDIESGSEASQVKEEVTLAEKETVTQKAPSLVISAATSGDAPVDMNHINEYFGDDEAERNELIEMFLEVTAQSLEELKGLAADDQQVQWKKTAHKLKGSAANFGAPIMAAACKEAEFGFEKPENEKNVMLKNIEASFDAIKQFFGKP